jgi:putative hemolysin
MTPPTDSTPAADARQPIVPTSQGSGMRAGRTPLDRIPFGRQILSSLQRSSREILLPQGLPVTAETRLPPKFGPLLGRIGSLEVRLATGSRDVKQAQKLRYQVFHEEMSAIPDVMSRIKQRDIDAYDAICDHLLVIDHDAPGRSFGKGQQRKPKVVGTYRLLRQEVAQRHSGFYSASEFDIAPLLAANPGKRFLELGRSCVLEPYRDKRTVELLWHGIWAYVLHHRIDAMFGCASLEGTDANAHALPLSFLHHHALAPAEWRVRALPHRHVPMDRLPAVSIDPKRALRLLPPLIKGYLRLGATFGEGAVVDRRFGTTDVLVILPVSAINPRYITHFGVDASRHAA